MSNPIKDINYTDKVNCKFSELVYKSMVTKRYGIKICCDIDSHVEIDKELLDLNNQRDTVFPTSNYALVLEEQIAQQGQGAPPPGCWYMITDTLGTLIGFTTSNPYDSPELLYIQAVFTMPILNKTKVCIGQVMDCTGKLYGAILISEPGLTTDGTGLITIVNCKKEPM